jgi:hypothetical protein
MTKVLANGAAIHSPLPICLFAHGWAYSLDFFTPLVLDLNTEHPALMKQYKTLGLEQGYFERPAGLYEWTGTQWEKSSDLNPKTLLSPTIGVGHSLGFAKLLDMPLNWTALVSLHGFTRFTSRKRGQSGTPKRMVERMLSRLSTNPDKVLQDFWTRAEERDTHEHDGSFNTGRVNLERLRGDLQRMMELDLKLNLESTLRRINNHKLLAIWSAKDQIVDHQLSAQTFPEVCMHEANAPHSGPLVSPKVYTHKVACTLGNAPNEGLYKPLA